MYTIDINLLRERAEYQTGAQSEFINNTTIAPTAKYGKAPLFVGVGIAALSMLLTGGCYLFLGQQTTQLEAKQKDLDQKLGSLKAQDATLAQLNGQIAQANEQNQSLAGVFNQVQPWSAILQDLRESIPKGVQISKIVQTSVAAAPAPAPATAAPAAPSGGLVNKISTPPNPEAKPSAAPSATPATTTTATPSTSVGSTPAIVATLPADVPTTKIEITGTAKSFEEVNNFMLTLKQSAFFSSDETQLVSANLTPSTLVPVTVDKNGAAVTAGTTGLGKSKTLELPKVVTYQIQTSIKRVPAADLIRELERKGAVGLVTRLRSLQQQQAIKP
ncbi:PilN domain-containing protein [Chamaesiphon sp. VAR_48_metabat_403]|uniref:PilN domain-containing protein n=1 Tax=Chamaesiphon sp. VAR_48_metabat_403 TaxID=2964700 RepID=UPI00286E1558|nr:PilN domain-containing protein [Chamaesiphon sp. VAR_48_metabat_403]